MKHAAALFIALIAVIAPAAAEIRVSTAAELARAVRDVRKGETITLAAGTYAVSDLKLPRDMTLAGDGAVTLTAASSVEKGLLNPLPGASVTIRNIRFEDARSPDENGAGIRHDGDDLTLVDCVFEDNENGVLATGADKGRIIIRGGAFIGNGHGDGYSHGIYVSRGALLDIEGARFAGTRIGHHVKSLADVTRIAGNEFDDGDGRTSYAVDASRGGAVTIENNSFLKAANADNPALINYDLTRGGKALSLVIVNNRIVNRYRRAQLLRNETSLAPTVSGNEITNEQNAAMSTPVSVAQAANVAQAAEQTKARFSVVDGLPAAMRGTGYPESRAPRAAQKIGTLRAPSPPQDSAIAHIRLVNNWNETTAAMITVGAVFAKGALTPEEGAVAIFNGERAPAQVDIKALHDDGTVRHAALTFAPPALKPGAAALIAIERADPSNAPALDALAAIRDAYDFPLAMVFHYEDGDESASVNARDLLVSALETGAAQAWLSGPLAAEYRVEWRPREQLGVIFDIRVLADGTVRTSVVFDNSLSFSPGYRHHLYDVAIGARDAPFFLAESVSHHRSSRWRRVFWSSGAKRAFAAQATDDLIAANAILPLDPSLGVDAATIAEDDAALADLPPLDPAQITQYFPETGGRPDIGPYAGWTAHFLVAQTEPAARVMFAAAEAGAAVPWHFTDDATGAPVSIETRPKFWADDRGLESQYGRDRPHEDVFSSPDGGWTPDHSHKPDLFFIPYLLTADRFYADELAMQAAYAVFGRWPDLREGGVKAIDVEQVRASAWSLRDLSNAAFILPARHPSKAYLERVLAHNLRLMREKYVDRGEMRKAGALEGYFQEYIYGDPERISPWQNDYVAISLWLAARRGNADAATIMRWTENFAAGRYLDPAFPSAYASAYRFPAKDADTEAPVADWAELAARIRANPGDAPDLAGYPGLSYSYAASGEAALAALASQSGSPEALEGLAAALERGRNDPRWDHYAPGGARRHNNFFFTLINARGARYARDSIRFGKDGDDGDEFIIGDAGNNRLAGGAGDDYLFGLEGRDTLDGGPGDDHIGAGRGGGVLSGGPGRDVFLVSRYAAGETRITDFAPGDDRLVLSPRLLPEGSVIANLPEARPDGSVAIALGGASIILDGVSRQDVASAVTVSH